MKNSILNKYLLAVLASCSVNLALEASASPITGLIDFEGLVTADNSDLSLATHFSFSDVTVGVGRGTFSSLVGSSVAQADLTFRPVPVAPILNFWSITKGGITYSFDLDVVGLTALNQGPHFVGLQGIGFAHATGFDDTLATWSLAATSQGGNVFTFSESTANANGIGINGSVPDNQETAGLLGIGLCVLGLLRCRTEFAA